MLKKSEMAYRPCVVLARSNPSQGSIAGRQLRRLGWDVYLVRTGTEARRLARMIDPELVVLDADLDEESGWLTCAKLHIELPELPILLVGDNSHFLQQERADFVGAAGLFNRADGTAGLVNHAVNLVPVA